MTISVAGDQPDWYPAQAAANDVLMSLTTVTPTVSGIYEKVFDISKSYQSLAVSLGYPTKASECDISVLVSDPSGNVVWEGVGDVDLATGEVAYRSIPIPSVVKGSLTVTVTTSLAPPDTFEISVVGSVTPLAVGSQLFRSDGRPYPLGTSRAEATATAISPGTSLVAAPGAGYRLLVKSVHIACHDSASGYSTVSVTGTIGGATSTLLLAVSSADHPGHASREDESGLLLDDDTGVNVSIGGSDGSTFNLCSIVYDKVS